MRAEFHNLWPINPLPPVMDTTEVSVVLRCPTSTVERYVHNHELVAIQIGKARRFRAEDVLEFIAGRPGATLLGRNRAWTPPDVVRDATRAYERDEDHLGAFIDEVCVEGPKKTASAVELLEAYRKFTGDKRLTSKRLENSLSERGYEKRRDSRTGRTHYYGLELRTGKKRVGEAGAATDATMVSWLRSWHRLNVQLRLRD